MSQANEDKRAFLSSALGGATGSISDLEYQYLLTLVSAPDQGSIPDMWRKYLISLGYSGSVSDMRSNLTYPRFTGGSKN